MPEDIPLLDQVRVAAPCPANWNEMVGGDRVRYCRACEKNVYNLSEMSKNDAEKLLQTHEGRLCIRYYRRADGNIMTNNCPVGLRTIRKAYLKTAAGAAALFGVMFGGLASMGARKQEPEPAGVAGGIEKVTPPITPTVPTMGDMIAPPPHRDPERGQVTGGIAALPRDLVMGRMTAHQPASKIDPSVEVSDNTDDEDDATDTGR